MTPFGPLSCGTVGGSAPADDCNPFDSGQLGGELSAVSATFAASSSLAGAAWHCLIAFYDGSNTLISASDSGTLSFGANPTFTLTPAPPAGATRFVCGYGAAMTGVLTSSVTVNGTYTNGTYCAYGTRSKGVGIDVVDFTADALLAIVGYFTSGVWTAVALFFTGRSMNVKALCQSNRPLPVDFTAQDYLNLINPFFNTGQPAAIVKAWAWLQWAAWPYFCECVPGAPAPSAPRQVNQPAPPGLDTGPSTPATCDNGDICSTLNRIIAMLQALASGVTNIYNTANYNQTTNAPSSYTDNSTTTTINNSGSITAPDILGVHVEVTIVPPGWGLSGDDPQRYIPAVGSVAFWSTDGVLETFFLNNAQSLCIPQRSGLVDRFTYSLKPGVTATVTQVARQG
jgi:hypothetical protein